MAEADAREAPLADLEEVGLRPGGQLEGGILGPLAVDRDRLLLDQPAGLAVARRELRRHQQSGEGEGAGELFFGYVVRHAAGREDVLELRLGLGRRLVAVILGDQPAG